MVGFANVEGTLFGSRSEYVEPPYIHVSHEHRGQNIGKALFALCCEKARSKGAQKLYIAAHPSLATQQFYRSVGCALAAEINRSIYERSRVTFSWNRCCSQ